MKVSNVFCNTFSFKHGLFLFCLFSSALAWLAGVVSLNDLRLSANMPRDNFGATVASDGKMKRLS